MDDIQLLKDSLEPRGLYLLILVNNIDEVNVSKSLLGM
jgi:hypothetical protein